MHEFLGPFSPISSDLDSKAAKSWNCAPDVSRKSSNRSFFPVWGKENDTLQIREHGENSIFVFSFLLVKPPGNPGKVMIVSGGCKGNSVWVDAYNSKDGNPSLWPKELYPNSVRGKFSVGLFLSLAFPHLVPMAGWSQEQKVRGRGEN